MATKIVDATKLDNALGATADAIRSKTGNSSGIIFDMVQDHGFADAIAAIPTGDGRCPRTEQTSTLQVALPTAVVSVSGSIDPNYVTVRFYTHISEEFLEPVLLYTYHLRNTPAVLPAVAVTGIRAAADDMGCQVSTTKYALSSNGEYISGSLTSVNISSDTDFYMDVSSLPPTGAFSIIQNHTGDEAATFVVSNNNRTLTITFTPPVQASGIVFTLKDEFKTGYKANFAYVDNSAYIQRGTCNTSATLPTVVSTGANRRSYDSNRSGTFTYKAGEYWFMSIDQQNIPVQFVLTRVLA